MPQDTCGNAAPGAPGFANVSQFRRIGTRRQPLYAVGCRLERNITDRPDIRAHQRHQQIDICGLCPDPLHLNQLCAHVIVSHAAEPVEAQRLVQQAFG